ncbi:hypothetical protein BDB00DRAFT_753133 [Zychaea mexicana]|uniref:uncharacterized protein n=1 Tax=Zychaea mexicana TaxID=64656 RepID=UPI0022FEFD1B|nr:uncharacterized protein BDB00DRAFT_753133 [Zychaea mexicana]KAI9499598.1 hypothetical protein BDB00DRAFT_753133 [Zychaea mexicana]
MTLDQLTKVHRDGIVDDEIVFRALWQQKQFEQLLLPAMRGYSYDDDIDEEDSDERHAALNDFFDVSDSDDYRRQILLGTAKYRFCMTITLSPPCTENGWIRDENVSSSRADDDDDDSPGNPDVIWRKTFYSQPEVIWGTTYRIQIEAQVIPHHLLVIQDDDDDSDTNGSNISRVVNDDTPSQFTSTTIPKQPRIRYTIHCLNRREGLIENHRVDPEDRMLVAVTDMSEGEDNSQTGYVGQVQLDGYDLREHIKVDTVVCLDVFGFNKYVQ